MKQHQDLMRNILENGDVKTDRTGTGTISLFGGMMKFSLEHNVWPIPTTRQVDHEKISSELEWMLKGIISVQWLKDRKNPIWNSWMGPESGTIGPMYGEQWRNYDAAIRDIGGEDEERLRQMLRDEAYTGSSGAELTPEMALNAIKAFVKEKTKLYQDGGRGGTDQLQYVVDELNQRPDSRRIVVNVWHAALLPDPTISPAENADSGKMALAPCHSTWQVNTAQLSDMEILRQIAYSDSGWNLEVQKQLAMLTSIDSTRAAEQIRKLTNVWMNQKNWLVSKHEIPLSWEDMRSNPTEKPYDIVADYAFEITDKGQSLIDSYKGAGLPTRKLSLLCFARSQDVPLGTVFNVGMYSLLAHQLAAQTNMIPWEYTHLMGDYHIYTNQVEGVKKQLKRQPLKPAQILVDRLLSRIEDFDHRNVHVTYSSHDKIVFPRAAV